MNTASYETIAQTVSDLPNLINNLLLLLSDKEKEVITKRFNLEESGKYTLEQIGKDFNVTRERVRQIEKNALFKMKRNVFNTALKDIHAYSLDVVKNNGGLLREKALLKKISTLTSDPDKLKRSHVHLSLVLHESLECIGNTINFHPYVKDHQINEYHVKDASNHLINQLHKYGNVKKIERIHRDLNKVFQEYDFDHNSVRSLIDIDKRVTLLDDDLVGLLEWRHIHPRTLRDKIMYILRQSKKPLHFSDIAARIEDANFDKRKINIQAVHNELIRHESFVLIGRGIYALAEWGYEKGTVADVIESILNEEGELSQEEIVDKVLSKRQVKKITIHLALKNNPKFERVGRKRYKMK